MKSYASIDELLADEVDLVIVNTPSRRITNTLKVFWKACRCRKAFTTTVEQAQELAAIAKEKNVKLSVFKTVVGTVISKPYKKLFQMRFGRMKPNSILIATIRFESKQHKTLNSGAGILKDLGPHLIDQALCLFGLPQSVFADIRITRAHSLVDDYIDILLYYASFRVRIKASLCAKPIQPMSFTEGSFLKARGDVQEDELKLGKNQI
jgi:predicted dehydrogenase